MAVFLFFLMSCFRFSEASLAAQKSSSTSSLVSHSGQQRSCSGFLTFSVRENPYGLPTHPEDYKFPNRLNLTFEGLSRWRSKRIAAYVQRAEYVFRRLLMDANLNPNLPHMSRTHAYADTAGMAFVIASYHGQEQSAVSSALVGSFFTHYLDDWLDRRWAWPLSDILIHDPAPNVDSVLMDLDPKFHRLWRNLMVITSEIVSHFDEPAFRMAMLRMMYGSPMFSNEIDTATRGLLRLQHRALLEQYARDPEVKAFIHRVDLQWTSLTSKVLFEMIPAFEAHYRADPDLNILLNYAFAPALSGHDLDAEIETGEVRNEKGLKSVVLRGNHQEELLALIRHQLSKNRERIRPQMTVFLQAFMEGFDPILKSTPHVRSFYQRLFLIVNPKGVGLPKASPVTAVRRSGGN